MVSGPITINHQSQFPVVTLSFNLAPGASLGDAVQHIKDTTQALGMPASIEPSFQGTAHAFESSLANESILILAAIITVYIVLGMLYESFIQSDHDSLDAAVSWRRRDHGAGALQGRSRRHRAHRHHPADRHRQEKRDHDDRLRARSRAQRRQVARGSDLSGVPTALPSDHDDHAMVRRCSAPFPWRSAAASDPNCGSRSASASSAACWSARC